MKAINISLLLPKVISEEVIQLQNILRDSNLSQFPWYPFFRLPHITLCHLYLNDKEIHDISEDLEKLVTEIWPIELVNLWIDQWNLNHISSEKSTQLIVLHKKINRLVSPYCWRAWKSEYFLGTDICDMTVWRINEYSYEKYSPHITLWPWTTDSSYSKRIYTASWIALCHLGRYCTVGEVLKTFDLS